MFQYNYGNYPDTRRFVSIIGPIKLSYQVLDDPCFSNPGPRFFFYAVMDDFGNLVRV